MALTTMDETLVLDITNKLVLFVSTPTPCVPLALDVAHEYKTLR